MRLKKQFSKSSSSGKYIRIKELIEKKKREIAEKASSNTVLGNFQTSLISSKTQEIKNSPKPLINPSERTRLPNSVLELQRQILRDKALEKAKRAKLNNDFNLETNTKNSTMIVQDNLNFNFTTKTSVSSKSNPYLQNQEDAFERLETRKIKKLNFNPQGKYVKLAQQIRDEERIEKLKELIEQNAFKVGIDSEFDQESDIKLKKQAPPKIELWDYAYVDNSYDRLKDEENKLINSLVHHPVPIQPKFERNPIKPRSIILTPKERKKLRRQRRMQALKEKQEKQKLGLIPPDEPKVKISNMMKVFTDEAIQDPTQIENKIQQEIEKRRKKHEEQNLSRKLTKQEKQTKRHKKYIQDIKQNGFFSMVFKLGNIRNMQHRYKVDINAQELNLTGVLITNSRFCLVVVEGPSKSIKKYKKLMLRRIDWEEESKGEIIAEEQNSNIESKNYCILIWEGDIKDRTFKGFKIAPCPTENKIRDVLGRGKNDHYWDLAKAYKREEITEESKL